MINLDFTKQLSGPGGHFTLHINCRIRKGDFVAVYGPSGAGKTTLLRCIAGLSPPGNGHITVAGQPWFSAKGNINRKPQQRSAGLVFQDYALFPNMTVEKNIRYAMAKGQDSKQVAEVIELMGLQQLLGRQPTTLSGGQQQRVALARSLVRMPQVLMLDEPMSALDLEMRHKIQDYLLTAHKKYNLTTLLVSHDVGEIFKLANKVMVLDNGTLQQFAAPAEVFLSKETGGNFQFAGEVLSITREEVIYVVTILIGQQVVKVVAEESTASTLKPGDKVLVTAKAFNPIIQRL